MPRSAGILMPITSLPSPYGIGTLGKAAYEFVDFLKAAGQTYWQLLPVGPTSYGDSPYQSFSTYAGNPYMIDLDILCDENLLTREELKNIDWGSNSQYVDYERLYNIRFEVLRKAYEAFKQQDQQQFWDFMRDEDSWLTDYALYMSVKKFFDDKPWTEWPDHLIKYRNPDTIDYYLRLLYEDVMFWKWTQFMFYKQWAELREYANGNGIKLFGDMPIYVAMDSADTWANPDVFWLDDERKPVCVAGCPPDYFSETGQLWGNPLYDWIYLEETNFDWWINRVAGAQRMFDVTRIDHFRAFDQFYAIPYGAENAVVGEWIDGPNMKFFDKMKQRLGDVPIIAEDLGLQTPGVAKLLKDSGYPGMKILEFAFDSKSNSNYLPHNYEKNSVCYTGTHDNDTVMGWVQEASEKDLAFAEEYCRLDKTEGYNWGFIRTAYASVSDYAIVQMQDFLGLGSEARINTPSTLGGNWTWRMKEGAATPKLAKKIYNLSKIYRRLEDDKKMKKNAIIDNLVLTAKNEYCKELSELSPAELHEALGKAMMGEISEKWAESKKTHASNRRAYYLSAEFLMGRMMYNNLYAMGVLEQTKKLLADKGVDINVFEEIDDAALGNGGLGRLAACFLDSAATHDVPLDGYGIRYKYGLFKQEIVDGFQVEVADDWQRFGDPWCIKRSEDIVNVNFADQTVKAVPYDMAIIGYGTDNINTLRLWEAEAVNDFNFLEFNDCKYDEAVKDKNDAENISKVLYPNDNSYEGKVLRLKQQYFFSSASLQDILKRYKAKHGTDLSHFAEETAIQLNDTHPTISIPEFVRLLTNDGCDFDWALDVARKTFSYTNHTVMQEALEKWDIKLMQSVIPDVYDIIVKINDRLMAELKEKKVSKDAVKNMEIIDGHRVHMARMASYISTYVNGVAAIHTQILKDDTLKEWYELYPERFQNKTNGVTQRRWLGLCNPEYAEFITDLIGNKWLRNLDELKKLEKHLTQENIDKFSGIKYQKKKELSEFIQKHEGVYIDPDFFFDIQVKRLHEYKRQLMNAFSIMAIYFRLKEGKLPNFTPTAFIFGAKAAPGYARAKAIIKYINEIAKLVNNDPDVNNKMRVVFVSNYNVSYAEKIIPAADIHEQISTAGTEASGTSNMKFMANGAVTIGTYDGANIEIAECAGEENEYIFGARVEEIEELKKGKYDPKKLYEANEEMKKVIDTLIDGRFSDGGKKGEGSFEELHKSLLEGASWHPADHYFILRDLPDYIETKIKANNDYKDKRAFGYKCLMNTANCGKFSSDRTILEYANELWKVKSK